MSVNDRRLPAPRSARHDAGNAAGDGPDAAERAAGHSRRERRDDAVGRRGDGGAAACSVSPARALLLELAALALESLERLQRLLALFHPAEAPVDAGEHVVVRGRARVERRSPRSTHRRRPPGCPCRSSARPCLKQCAVGLRVERQRLLRVFERLLGIARCGCSRRSG